MESNKMENFKKELLQALMFDNYLTIANLMGNKGLAVLGCDIHKGGDRFMISLCGDEQDEDDISKGIDFLVSLGAVNVSFTVERDYYFEIVVSI